MVVKEGWLEKKLLEEGLLEVVVGMNGRWLEEEAVEGGWFEGDF